MTSSPSPSMPNGWPPRSPMPAKRRLVLENRRLRAAAEAPAGLPLIGDTPAIRRLRDTIRQIADADVDVLVLGETGSGKEVVASLLPSGAGGRRGTSSR